MSHHRTVERLTPKGGAFLYTSSQRDEPLGGNQPQLGAVRLVNQHLGFGGIGNGADEAHIEKVDPHAARLVGNVPGGAGAVKFDAAERGEVSIMDGNVRVLVLLERRSHLRQVRLWLGLTHDGPRDDGGQ